MLDESKFAEAIGKLRGLLAIQKKNPEWYRQHIEAGDEVIARYNPIFNPNHVLNISEEEFRGYLNFKNNRHWHGLHRQGPKMCKNMPKLRKALSVILDENKQLEERLNEATNMVMGMGNAITTAILLIAYPERYGVWNSTSEAGMKILGIWPEFDRGESFGSRYKKVNEILLRLKDELTKSEQQFDLWTLDYLWWVMPEDSEGIEQSPTFDEDESNDYRFGLEKYLHEFLRDNWDRVELSKEWEIYKEPGNDEAGYKYRCSVGVIDLLAKHKKKPKWLVIELKRGQTSDQTVGQVLRYMGWVRKELAEKNNEEVDGLIIAYDYDDGLKFALREVDRVSLKSYKVDFRLHEPEDVA